MREIYRKHRKQGMTKMGLQEYKIIGMLLVIELLFGFYSAAKGKGTVYFQMACLLIPVSFITCFLVFKYNGDRYLLIWTLLLMNCGFMVQILTLDVESGVSVTTDVVKCAAGFLMAYIAALLFWKVSYLLSLDMMIPLFVGIQFALCIILIVLGEMVGEKGKQGAIVQLDLGPISIQPFEIVKVLYVFVVVILLCKDKRSDIKVAGMPRELVMIVYTLVLCYFFVKASEWGTMLIMLLTGGILFLIYSQNRKQIKWLCAIAAGGGSVVLTICFALKNKVYERIVYAWHPELDAQGSGYQGLLARKGLTVGGAFGPDTDRYIFRIPMEENDMIFVKLIQTCGLVMGILMIISLLLLLREGYVISRRIENSYYKGLAMGITIMITTQSLVHIGYNIGLFPITGIPLYFVSKGFTNTSIGLVLIGFLLIMSMEIQERSRYDENAMEERKREILQSILSKRKRA